MSSWQVEHFEHYSLRTTMATNHQSMVFEVFSIQYCDGLGRQHYLTHMNELYADPGVTTTLDDAEPLLVGTISVDGTCNYRFVSAQRSCRRREFTDLGALLSTIYDRAIKYMPQRAEFLVDTQPARVSDTEPALPEHGALEDAPELPDLSLICFCCPLCSTLPCETVVNGYQCTERCRCSDEVPDELGDQDIQPAP